MVDVRWYLGTVVVNDDSGCDDKQKLGRCQIRVIPEMQDVEAALLPWMRPFGVTGGQLDVPRVGALVWCISTDQYAKSWFYGEVVPIDDDLKIATTMEKISGVISAAKYPTTRFWRSLDDTIFFCDGQAGAVGILHASGAQITIIKDGTITIKGNQKVTISGGLANLGDTLIKLAEAIADMAKPTSLMGQAPFSPVLYANAGKTLTDMEMVKSNAKAFQE